MSDLESIRFACIGCGAMNPAGSETCSGCGHRFREPAPIPRPPIVPGDRYEAPTPRPDDSTNPYEAPRSRAEVAPTFRIGTAMALIVVVALCLAAFSAGTAQGVLVSLGLLPATIRTFAVAGRREGEGRPMSLEGRVLTFLSTVGGLIVVLFSTVVAFGLTCFPVAMASRDLGLSLFSGIVAALAAGGGLTYAMIRGGRAADRRERDRETIRWR